MASETPGQVLFHSLGARCTLQLRPAAPETKSPTHRHLVHVGEYVSARRGKIFIADNPGFVVSITIPIFMGDRLDPLMDLCCDEHV